MNNVILKQFMPPIITSLLKNNFFKRKKNIYPNYEQALRVCRDGAYQNKDVILAVVAKNHIYRSEINLHPILEAERIRILVALGLVNAGKKLNVVDFGGGAGSDYILARAIYGAESINRWHVVETKEMSKVARLLEDGTLEFFSSVQDAIASLKHIDLVLCNSSLQYCPDPLLSLREIINIRPDYLFITRTPFLDSNTEIISIQSSRLSDNGPGPLPRNFKDRVVTYPVTYVGIALVEAILEENYSIQFKIKEGCGGFEINNEEILMTGFFCKRK